MIVSPKLKRLKLGESLGFRSINEIIKRTEYAASLISSNSPIAGSGITLEKTSFGILIKSGASGNIVTDWAGFSNFPETVAVNEGRVYQLKLSDIAIGGNPFAFFVTGIYGDKVCGYFTATQGSKTNQIGFIYNYKTKGQKRYFNFPSGDLANNSTRIFGIYGNNYWGVGYDNVKYGNYDFTNFATYKSDGPYFINIADLYGNTFVGVRKFFQTGKPQSRSAWKNNQIINYPGSNFTEFYAIGNGIIFGAYNTTSPVPTNFAYKGNSFIVPQEKIVLTSFAKNATITLNTFLLSSKYVGINISNDPKYPTLGGVGHYLYDYINHKVVSIRYPEGVSGMTYLSKHL